jgi:hypothetical protein
LNPKQRGKLAKSYQQDYCLRAPDRTPALQTAESASAKRYARHTPSGRNNGHEPEIAGKFVKIGGNNNLENSA